MFCLDHERSTSPTWNLLSGTVKFGNYDNGYRHANAPDPDLCRRRRFRLGRRLGFSERNLEQMCLFYQTWSVDHISQTPSAELSSPSWSYSTEGPVFLIGPRLVSTCATHGPTHPLQLGPRRSLFEPRRMRPWHDQHCQTQTVQRTQSMLEINAFAILQLGQHAHRNPVSPRCLVNWHDMCSPNFPNMVAESVNGANRRARSWQAASPRRWPRYCWSSTRSLITSPQRVAVAVYAALSDRCRCRCAYRPS